MLATRPVKVNTARLKLAPKIENNTVQFSNLVKAKEPYKSLLVKQGDKAVKCPYFREYYDERTIKAFDKYIENYGNNSGLREGFINIGNTIRANAFKKALPLQEDAYVYRGIERLGLKSSSRFIDSVKEGTILVDEGCMSTSTSLEHIKNTIFIDNAIKNDGILFRIHLPKGTKGVMLNDNEFLLPNSSKLKIKSIETINGIKIAQCEYILPNSYNPEYINHIKSIAEKMLKSSDKVDIMRAQKILSEINRYN